MSNEGKGKMTLKTECKSAQALLKYLEAKAKNHKNFKTYMTMESFQYRKEQECIFLSTGRNWNDVRDREEFNQEDAPTLKFGACFSYSISESVAMWMLYGGMKRNGIMIDYKREHINTCLNSESVTLGIWEDGMFKPVDELQKGQYRFQLIDIIYMDDKDPLQYHIKRSDETCDIEEKTLNNVNCIKKTYPWNYENECRLILTINRGAISDRRINSAQISLPGVYETLIKEKRIYMAPNSTKSIDGFQQSTLRGKIDWDLCRDCQKISKPEKQLTALKSKNRSKPQAAAAIEGEKKYV